MDHMEKNQSLAGFFSRAFPVPKFLRMDSIGIDISDTSVRYLRFGRERKNGLSVKDFGSKKLPPGTIFGGQINKIEVLVSVLSEIRKETGVPFAKISLPEERAYLFKTEMPKMPDREIYDAIGFRIEENVPVSAKEAIYDYSVIDRGNQSEKSDHFDILVSVIPSKVSESYSESVKKAGFMPISFEIISQAVGRAVVPADSARSHLVINVGDTKTGLFIINQGLVFFTSTVPFGSSLVDEEIARHFGAPIESVGEIRREIITSGRQDMKTFFEVMESAALLKEELQKMIVYWKTHGINMLKGLAQIEKIILCGSETAMPAVDEYVEAITGIKTEVANVWGNIFSFEEYIPPISRVESLDYAGAIGLAMNGH